MLGMNFIINVMIKLLINLNYTIIYISFWLFTESE
jgi:hypothetical protein